jgi:hypothetical protein
VVKKISASAAISGRASASSVTLSGAKAARTENGWVAENQAADIGEQRAAAAPYLLNPQPPFILCGRDYSSCPKCVIRGGRPENRPDCRDLAIRSY